MSTEQKIVPENDTSAATEIAKVPPKRDGEEPMEQFDHPAEYWLACIGFAVGFGNIWRFPFMCYKMGGACFLIPYCISLFLIAMPMYLIETLFGQLIAMKIPNRYGCISPAFWGIVITQVFVCFFTQIYYINLMAWSFSYFFASFQDPLPWVEKSPEQKKADQAAIAAATASKNQKAINRAHFAAEWNPDYFHVTTLNKSASISETGPIQGWLVFCLFLSYICLYFAAWKGIKSTGKLVWVTCTAPYVILTILLIKGLTLPGMGIGLAFLFQPDWQKIGKADVWQAAAVQILFSSGVSFGPLIYYGSARKQGEKILKASFWIPMANSATSFYASITIFTFLGHVSYTLDKPIDQISDQGMDLAFVAYPGLLAKMGGANFWALIFFLMLVTLGIDSSFGMFDFYQTFISDLFPIILQKMRREYYCVILTCFCFICSLTFCNRAGFYTFGLFDTFSCGVSVLFCLLMELIFFGWFFGLDKFDVLLKRRTGESIPVFIKWIVKIFIPIFTSAMIIINLIGEFSEETSLKRNWPWWVTTLGRLLFIVPICSAFIGVIPAFRYKKTIDVYDLIEEQYGIRFNCNGFFDDTYIETRTEELAELAAVPPEKVN